MAVIQMNYFSWVLKRNVPVTVILPVDNHFRSEEIKEYKTLYLMHGFTDSCMDWMINTSIRRLAEERNLAVVMPSGDNSFYVNQMTPNNDYGEYIGKELVEMTRKMFPLSKRREDTFIAGNSMGGYGAVRNGLKYAETFSKIASFSGAFHMFELSEEETETELYGALKVYGDIAKAAKTDANPAIALEELLKRGIDVPQVYMCCGDRDELVESNRMMKQVFEENGVDLTYLESDGEHGWVYWEEHLLGVLEWLLG